MNNELITINAEHTAHIRLPWIISNRQYQGWSTLAALVLIFVMEIFLPNHITVLIHTIILVGAIVVTVALGAGDLLAEKIVQKQCRKAVQHIIGNERILHIEALTRYSSSLTINRAYMYLMRTEQGGITYERQAMILGSKLYISAAKREEASY